MELGSVQGPEMEFTFESQVVSIQLPTAVSGWEIIQPTPKLQVRSSRLQPIRFRLHIKSNNLRSVPVCTLLSPFQLEQVAWFV